MGTVRLDASLPGWPLAAGRYTAHYLAQGGYWSIASADFTVQ
jgi:hypothetical protein